MNSNIQEFPTAKGCQHPTAKSSQHDPKSHLSVSSIHSRSRNLQKGLQSGICLPLSSWTYHHITAVAGPKHHTLIPHPSNLHTYWLDLPPQNISGRPKTPHSQPPPFQPPSLSSPSFHHIQKLIHSGSCLPPTPTLPTSILVLCFHGCFHELFNIEGLFLQIQSSLKNHPEPPR